MHFAGFEQRLEPVKPIIMISVICPIYNEEKYIAKCIESILDADKVITPISRVRRYFRELDQ